MAIPSITNQHRIYASINSLLWFPIAVSRAFMFDHWYQRVKLVDQLSQMKADHNVESQHSYKGVTKVPSNENTCNYICYKTKCSFRLTTRCKSLT